MTTRLANPRVLVFERYDPTDKSLDWLRSQGVDVVMGHPLWEMPLRRFSEPQFVAAAQGCVGVMGASGVRFTDHLFDQLPDLRFISKFGIGFDSIDIDAATRRRILISNTPDDYQIFPVSEHAIALMLALAKQLGTWTPEFMRSGGWRGLTHGATLSGATVGVIGLGRIGRGVVQRLAGWEVEILAYDPYLAEAPNGVQLVDLQTLLERSDFVTLHAAPGPDNRLLLNSRTLALMKPSAVVVNTGRGSLIDYDALRAALRSGVIAGAALDVFDREPPDPQDPLFAMRNVICTPHVAAWTARGTQEIGWHGARNLVAMLRGEPCEDIVNLLAVDGLVT